jgi:hypothetical protein
VERETRMRVEAMMEGWRKGGRGSGGDMQEAVCMWFNGKKITLDDIKLAKLRDQSDDFRREKRLYKALDSWEITSMDNIPETEPTAMLVGVKIDGKQYRMRVQDGYSIAWAR